MRIIEKICEKITHHKYRKLWAYCEDIEPKEYYYKCKICGKSFWNSTPPTDKANVKRMKK